MLTNFFLLLKNTIQAAHMIPYLYWMNIDFRMWEPLWSFVHHSVEENIHGGLIHLGI